MISSRPCLALILVTGGWNLAHTEPSSGLPPTRAQADTRRPDAPDRAVPPSAATRSIQLRRVESSVHMLVQRGAFAAALQEIDELDLLAPSAAPHTPLRLMVHEAAVKAAGASPAALAHLKACLRHLPEDDTSRQVAVAETLFELGRQLTDWEAALHGASLLLLLEPVRQEDALFMQAAQEVRALASLRRRSDEGRHLVASNPR